MGKASRFLFWAVLGAILATSASAIAAGTPEITSPVTDRADVISQPVEARLGERLRTHFDETGVQMAVLTVRTTDGEPIEDFSFWVADAWAGGNAGQDRGILLTLAIDDRRSRLEVGYGLESVISDLRASRMLRRMRPKMRQGDYGGAVTSMVGEVLDGTDHLEVGKRPGLWDIHPLWNGALGMLLIAIMGLGLVGAPAVAVREQWLDVSENKAVALCLGSFAVGAGLVFWLAQGIAPWGYLAIFASGAFGGAIIGVADGFHRVAPIAALFLFLCMVAMVPAFNGGLPPDADGKLLFCAIFYAAGALLPYSSTWDTGTGVRRRDEDGGFTSGSSGSSSGGGYSGGGGSFGGGGASGGW